MAVKDQANISVDYWLCGKYSHFSFRFQVFVLVFAMKMRLFPDSHVLVIQHAGVWVEIDDLNLVTLRAPSPP